MKYLLVFVVVVILVGAGIFLYTQKKLQFPAYSGPVEKITIANIGEYSVFNLIAKEKGYFKQNGLDATIVEYDSGATAIKALLEGQANFAIGADFAGVRGILANDNLRILVEVGEGKVFQLVARKDKGISTPADLEGKKIGFTAKTAGEFMLGRFLVFNNLSLKDVTVVNLPPDELATQIESGQVDAVVAFDPLAYNIQKSLGNNGITWSAQGDQDIYALVYSTNTFIKAHPSIVERYLVSLIEAEQFLNEHNAEAKALVAKTLHYDGAYMQYMWPKSTFTLFLGQSLLLTLEDDARWIIENKLTDKTEIPHFQDYIYKEPLKKLKMEAVTIY